MDCVTLRRVGVVQREPVGSFQSIEHRAQVRLVKRRIYLNCAIGIEERLD
jgi:hypothetical protein